MTDYIKKSDVIKSLMQFAEGKKTIGQCIDECETVEPKTDWIPVKFRPLTKEEQEKYPDYCYMADCLMPDEGDEILITTTHGTVEKDEAGFDDGFYLDSVSAWQTDVVAWMPLPPSYQEETKGVSE